VRLERRDACGLELVRDADFGPALHCDGGPIEGNLHRDPAAEGGAEFTVVFPTLESGASDS